jgi:hypothetical protein
MNFFIPATIPVPSQKASFTLARFGLEQLRKALFVSGEIPEFDPEIRRSSIGTPIYKFADVRLASGQRDSATGNSVYPESLLDTCLIEFSQPKNIVITPVQGRDTGVIEYISRDNAQIRLRGILDSGNMNVYPEDAVRNLITLLNLPESLSIISPFLQLMGIDEVVVQDFTLSQDAGGYNYQAYEISLIENIPLQLLPENA